MDEDEEYWEPEEPDYDPHFPHEHDSFYEEFSSGPDYWGTVVIECYCWCGTWVSRYTSSIL